MSKRKPLSGRWKNMWDSSQESSSAVRLHEGPAPLPIPKGRNVVRTGGHGDETRYVIVAGKITKLSTSGKAIFVVCPRFQEKSGRWIPLSVVGRKPPMEKHGAIEIAEWFAHKNLEII